MDPIRIEKFQAMKRYRRRKQQFLPSLVQYLAAFLFPGLFLASPLWIPHMCSCLNLFFLVSLPNLVTVMSGPKCLFVVCNIIVIFLVRESKLSSSSLQAADIYEEYLKRKSNNRERQQAEGRGKKKSLTDNALDAEEEEMVRGEYELGLDGSEEEKGPSEIDKRAEDFIARVNWQRRLEATRLLSHE